MGKQFNMMILHIVKVQMIVLLLMMLMLMLSILLMMIMMWLQIVKGSSSAFGGDSFHEQAAPHQEGKRWV